LRTARIKNNELETSGAGSWLGSPYQSLGPSDSVKARKKEIAEGRVPIDLQGKRGR